MSLESGPSGDKDNNDDERHSEGRRKSQKPGPPFVDDQGDVVSDDRRLRPDPRLDRLIEADWEETEESDPAGPAKED